MKYRPLPRVAVLLALVITTAAAARAQGQRGNADDYRTRADVLDALPPSDFVFYADVRRIMDVAAPLAAGSQQRAALTRLAREVSGFQRLTGIDPRSLKRVAVGCTFDPFDRSKSTGVVLVESTLSARDLYSALARSGRAKPRVTSVAGRDAFVISGASLLPDLQARALADSSRQQDTYVVEASAGFIAIGDRASVERSLASLAGDAPRSLGLDALPWAGRSEPIFSLFLRVPPQMVAPELPSELKSFAPAEQVLRALSSVKELQAAVGMDGNDFKLMMSVRTDSAQSANNIYTSITALGPAIEQAQQESEPTASSRDAEAFLRSLQLSVTGDYVTLTGTLKSSALRNALYSARPGPKAQPGN